MLRIGLLGASNIAPNAVLTPVSTNPDFTVTAVGARDKARAAEYAQTHAIPNVAEGYVALIARDDVDIVYNALPPAGHAEWTIKALEAGKHVLCEKPFCRNAAEARAMVTAAEKAGRTLMEAYHYRYHTVMQSAVTIVGSGRLGTITRAKGNFSVPVPRNEGELRWSAEQYGGALMDLGCYPLHALRSTLGAEPEIVRASAVFDGGVDASLSATLRFGAAEAELECSMAPELIGANLSLEGENGRLDIINFVGPQIGCRFTVTIDGKTEELNTQGPTTYQAQLAHLGECLKTGAAPLTSGADSIAQMSAIDAIYRAAGRP